MSFDDIIGKSCEPEIDWHAGSWFTRNFLCQITNCSFILTKLCLHILPLFFLLHFRSKTGNFFTEHMVHFTGGRHCHVLFDFAQFCAFQRNSSMSEGDFVCFPKEAKNEENQDIKKISCFLWFNFERLPKNTFQVVGNKPIAENWNSKTPSVGTILAYLETTA